MKGYKPGWPRPQTIDITPDRLLFPQVSGSLPGPMSNDRPVTIKDVAREAGVTPAAVSMALRGPRRLVTAGNMGGAMVMVAAQIAEARRLAHE